MKYRTLGQTSLEVSEIGLGAYPLSGQDVWSGTTDDESVALIHRCQELGVNLIDSAEGYGAGHSEDLTGIALKGRRDKWVVATKVTPNRGLDREKPDEQAARNRIREACEGSLKRLQSDYIDLYQLHAIPFDWAMPVTMSTLAELQKEGKIRWYGISTNNRDAIDRLGAHGPIHLLQVGYNLLERAADELLHWAKEKKIGTLIRVPLAKGQLSGKYFGPNAEKIPEGDTRYERFQSSDVQEGLKKLPELLFLQNEKRTMVQAALRFVLDHPGVSCVIAGAKNRQQVEQNAQASEMVPITDEELAKALPLADTIGTGRWVG